MTPRRPTLKPGAASALSITRPRGKQRWCMACRPRFERDAARRSGRTACVPPPRAPPARRSRATPRPPRGRNRRPAPKQLRGRGYRQAPATRSPRMRSAPSRPARRRIVAARSASIIACRAISRPACRTATATGTPLACNASRGFVERGALPGRQEPGQTGRHLLDRRPVFRDHVSHSPIAAHRDEAYGFAKGEFFQVSIEIELHTAGDLAVERIELAATPARGRRFHAWRDRPRPARAAPGRVSASSRMMMSGPPELTIVLVMARRDDLARQGVGGDVVAVALAQQRREIGEQPRGLSSVGNAARQQVGVERDLGPAQQHGKLRPRQALAGRGALRELRARWQRLELAVDQAALLEVPRQPDVSAS